jgi:hypothetical protein
VKYLTAIPIAALATVALAAPASAAPQATQASCSVLTLVADIAPPLSMTPAPTTTSGQNGRAVCSGTVDGVPIDSTVDGSFSLTASSPSANCDDVGGGAGDFTLSVTTQDGAAHSVAGGFSWTGVAGGLIVFTGALEATGPLTPVDETEDCVNVPLTKALIDISGATITTP